MSQSTRKFMQSNLNVSHCPSDSSSQGLSTTQFQWAGVQVGLTNYKGVMGENAVYLPSQEESYKIGTCAGLFFRTNYQRSIRLLVGEDVVRHNDHSANFFANSDWCSCEQKLNYMPNPSTPRSWPQVISFCSNHSGGANFALADGLVKFISQGIHLNVCHGFCKRNGGEIATVEEL